MERNSFGAYRKNSRGATIASVSQSLSSPHLLNGGFHLVLVKLKTLNLKV